VKTLIFGVLLKWIVYSYDEICEIYDGQACNYRDSYFWCDFLNFYDNLSVFLYNGFDLCLLLVAFSKMIG
jgi:hypothetical protein